MTEKNFTEITHQDIERGVARGRRLRSEAAHETLNSFGRLIHHRSDSEHNGEAGAQHPTPSRLGA